MLSSRKRKMMSLMSKLAMKKLNEITVAIWCNRRCSPWTSAVTLSWKKPFERSYMSPITLISTLNFQLGSNPLLNNSVVPCFTPSSYQWSIFTGPFVSRNSCCCCRPRLCLIAHLSLSSTSLATSSLAIQNWKSIHFFDLLKQCRSLENDSSNLHNFLVPTSSSLLLPLHLHFHCNASFFSVLTAWVVGQGKMQEDLIDFLSQAFSSVIKSLPFLQCLIMEVARW